MTKLFAFGDSFVVGDLDDFGPKDFNYNPDFPPTHNMSYDERIKYLKNNVSFASLIAKHYNFDYENLAIRGTGNFFQLDQLLLAARQGKFNQGDIILFGITINSRDRLSMIDIDLGKNSPLGIISYDLKDNHENLSIIEEFDFFWILSILESVRRIYKVKIIAFNLFYNPLCKIKNSLKFDFDFFIGEGIDNNTMVDVLNDTYDLPADKKHVYHTLINIPKESNIFYTWNKHPSELGHIKIKDWLVNYIDKNNLI